MAADQPFAGERPLVSEVTLSVTPENYERKTFIVPTLPYGSRLQLISLTPKVFDDGGEYRSYSLPPLLELKVVNTRTDADVWLKCSFSVSNEYLCKSYSPRGTKWLHGNGEIISGVHTDHLEYFIVRIYVYGPPLQSAPGTECFKGMRGLDSLSDVTLSAADGTELPAHRLVLAARSPAFKAMFSGDFKEAASTAVVPVDCASETLSCFLDCVYSGVMPDLKGDPLKLLDVMRLCDMYLVEALKAECATQLESVRGSSALEVLRVGLAGKHTLPEAVIAKAAAAVHDDLDAVAASDEWKQFCKDFPGCGTLLKLGVSFAEPKK